MSTHARRLAEWLADRSDAELSALFAHREVSSRAEWNDFFDAAEALLDSASLAKLLPQLTRDEAAVLLGVEEIPDAARTLQSLALLDAEGNPYPAVTAAIGEREVPAASVPDSDESPEPAELAHAAERAFMHIAAIAEVLLATREVPLMLLANGTVSAAARRRFAETASLPQECALDDLVAHALAARLAVAEERMLQLTRRGDEWLRSSVGERWAAVAEGFRTRLPRGLRTAAGGWIPARNWQGVYCWNPDWPSAHRELLRHAKQLGLLADGVETPWALPLSEGSAADAATLQGMLPSEVDKIFLQNDLSAIAPGPLAPALDMRLRTLAVRESASQASSFRFTAGSVARALALGETEQSLREFLGELSLTGIPQPLEYLIAQTAARHGLVRISSSEDGTHSRIRSTDAHLLDAIEVDQALRPLAFTRRDDELHSKVGATTAFWALSDARYPVTLMGADGEPVVAGRGTVVDSGNSGLDAADYAPLIARLRASHGPDSDAAWLERALDAAVQERAVLRVEVAMPDGSTRELTLEATGLGGGRLRGLDRAADVERTLPVRSIRSATPVDS